MSAEPEILEADEVEILEGSLALAAVDKASIDMQIATAKQYPRTVTRALEEARTLATMDEETAASCFYALPRSGKAIEGPSARLAEIMAYSWGNLRADADIVAEDRTHVTAMGTCFDLEKNVAVRVRVKRRITDKNGRRYNEDMIGVTSNAAISIALRNAVFKVIPRTYTDAVYKAARKASLGQGGTISQARQKSIDWFGKMNVTPDQIFEVLGVAGLDDIGEEEVIRLRGMATAIKDGESTVEQMFTPARHSEGTDELNAALEPDEPGKVYSKDDPDNPAGPAARFSDLITAENLDIAKARKLVAQINGLDDARRVTNEHYKAALKDVKSFLALYHGDDGEPEQGTLA